MAQFELRLDYDGQEKIENYNDDRKATDRALSLQKDARCFSATLYRYSDTDVPLMIAHWER